MKETTIREALGGELKFHTDLERLEKEELQGVPIVLWDARVIDDWDGQFGTTEFALLAVELDDGRKVTTLCGGKAVVRQARKLTNHNKLPGRIRCMLTTVDGPNGTYWLLDTPEVLAAEKTEEKRVEEELFGETS